MASSEFSHLLAAVIILTFVIGFPLLLESGFQELPKAFFFAVLILAVNIGAKKLLAFALDSDIEHEIWKFSRYGFKPYHHFKNELPGGIIFPLFISLFSLGLLKFSGILSYETRALKQRAAKRFGYYSYTEMTDWHNSLIGASGIVATLLLAVIVYLLPTNLEYLAKAAIFYAFSNMLPIYKLDGTQIFFGSRVLYTILGAITLILTAYAIII